MSEKEKKILLASCFIIVFKIPLGSGSVDFILFVSKDVIYSQNTVRNEILWSFLHRFAAFKSLRR